jgi:succinate dehydrogenase/fumarate reductase flavoprotein subunit
MKSQMEVIPVETDVLIIGGGLAGCMAAIKAREYDVKVTIAEKANTLSSGCAGTGVDHSWAYIPPVHEKMGLTLDDLVADHTRGLSQKFVNKELLRLVAGENYDRMLDLEKFGIPIRYKDSNIPGNFRVVYQFHSMPTSFNFDGRDLKPVLTKTARKRGVEIVNRVMIVSLLTNDGKIAGALGIGNKNGKIYSFKAKTVILCTGRINRITRGVTGVWGNHRIPVNETGDGRSMAFRAGLPLLNMEFISPSNNYSIGNFELNLGSPGNTVQPAASVVDGDGNVIVPRTQFYDWANLGKEKTTGANGQRNGSSGGMRARPAYGEMHQQGKGPFYLDLTGGTEDEINYIEWSIRNEGKGTLFLDYLKSQEGFDFRKDKLEWLPNSREMAGIASSGLQVDSRLETAIKGLFSAGDEVAGVPMAGAPGAFTMGWRAGEYAAKAAQQQKSFASTGDRELKELSDFCYGILDSKSGLHWREVEIAVQNVLDYYAGNVRSEKILKRGIERLNFIRQNAQFRAENPHELMRCLEVNSLIDNAGMILMSSIERQESRRAPFGFLRADYSEQDDENWLAFLGIRKYNGNYEFSKIPIT